MIAEIPIAKRGIKNNRKFKSMRMVETIIKAGKVVCMSRRDKTFPSCSLIIPPVFNKNPMKINASVVMNAKLTCPIFTHYCLSER